MMTFQNNAFSTTFLLAVAIFALLASPALGCIKESSLCFTSSSCCTGSCDYGFCTGCSGEGTPCTASANCCGSDSCDFGFCVGCSSTIDTPCTSDSNCCGDKVCNLNLCGPCVDEGAPCSKASDCCDSSLECLPTIDDGGVAVNTCTNKNRRRNLRFIGY